MSLGKTWYTLEDATAKFGVSKELILAWIEEGIIRTDRDSEQIMRMNGDDLKLKVQEVTLV